MKILLAIICMLFLVVCGGGGSGGSGSGDNPTDPTVDFSYNANFLHVDFNAVVSGGVATSYTWAFGDGTTGSGQNTSHSYASPGTYTVTLTVLINGQSVVKSKSISVSSAAIIAPTADFTYTADNGNSLKIMFTNISIQGSAAITA